MEAKFEFCLMRHRQFGRDSTKYPNPDTFSPERFLASEGNVKQADPRDYLFGFGRRYVSFPLPAIQIKYELNSL
jgi:cytochrome P450